MNGGDELPNLTTPNERRRRIAAIAEAVACDGDGGALAVAEIIEALMEHAGYRPQFTEGDFSPAASAAFNEVLRAFVPMKRAIYEPGQTVRVGEKGSAALTIRERFLAPDGSGWEYALSGEGISDGESFSEGDLFPPPRR